MKYITTLIFFSLLSWHVSAQAVLDNPNNVYQTKDGKSLTLEQVRTLLNSTQRYRLDKKPGENGKTLVTLSPISDKAFQKSILSNQKKVKKLKGSEMIPFSLADKEGQIVSNESLKGKLTVYNFWFTGCRPCLEELPQLNKLVDKYKDRVNFVAPTFEGERLVSKFLDRRTFKYQTLASGTDMIQALNITSFPTHMVVDKNGTIKSVVIGGSEDIGKTLEKMIKSNLK